MSKEEIIKRIREYVGENTYSYWYVGITDNPERRLFNANEHNVDKNSYGCIYIPAESKKDAQAIEEYFLGMGMDGDTGGGNDNSVCVYCYKKTVNTNP